MTMDKFEVVIYAMLVSFAVIGLIDGIVECNKDNIIAFSLLTAISIFILRAKLNEIKNK